MIPYFISCNFDGNQAYGENSKGGALFLNDIQFSRTTYSNFTKNLAEIGGAIYAQPVGF